MKPRPGQDLWHDAFDLCANSLHWLAAKLDPVWPGGMDYCKVNVLLAIALSGLLVASLGLNLAFLLGWL